MEHLGLLSLLSRFKKHLLNKDLVEDSFIKILKENFNIELQKENVSFKKEKINLRVRPILKTEITLKKQKILTLLKEQGFNVSDIF